MARRRVHEEQAQGELAAANGTVGESEKAARSIGSEIRNVLPPSRSTEVSRRMVDGDERGEMVSVTWGEELFTPVQFCSFRVGPFSASSTLRAGESREQAADRLMRELERIAAKERETKARVFKDALGKIAGKGT